jgi:hypothetical protein
MRVPTENATIIPTGPGDTSDPARFCLLGSLLVPHGGLLAAELASTSRRRLDEPFDADARHDPRSGGRATRLQPTWRMPCVRV